MTQAGGDGRSGRGWPRGRVQWALGTVVLLALGAILLVYAGHRWLGLADWYIVGNAYKALGTFGGEAKLLAWVALGTFCIVPSAFLLGMSFPVAQKAVQQDLGEVGLRVGVIQLANILGNTAGA